MFLGRPVYYFYFKENVLKIIFDSPAMQLENTYASDRNCSEENENFKYSMDSLKDLYILTCALKLPKRKYLKPTHTAAFHLSILC